MYVPGALMLGFMMPERFGPRLEKLARYWPPPRMSSQLASAPTAMLFSAAAGAPTVPSPGPVLPLAITTILGSLSPVLTEPLAPKSNVQPKLPAGSAMQLAATLMASNPSEARSVPRLIETMSTPGCSLHHSMARMTCSSVALPAPLSPLAM